jgi:hypothetical protein
MGTGLQSISQLQGSRCEHLVALVEFVRLSRTPYAPLWGSGVSWVNPFGSGSWAFAAPPSTFYRHRSGPRGLPSGVVSRGTSPLDVPSLDLDPPSGLSFRAGPGPSSPGSVRVRLSTDIGSRVHSRVPSRVPFGRFTAMWPVLFRLRGFAPPWRLSPLELRGLVSSRCRSEVHRVSASVAPFGSSSVLLTARLVPFEECPSSTAVPCHHGPCLPAVVAAPLPCSPSRLAPSDRSLLAPRPGRRSLVRGLQRSPSFLRSSPSPGLPDGVALAPSLRSTFGPRGAPTPRRFLREGGRSGCPTPSNGLPAEAGRSPTGAWWAEWHRGSLDLRGSVGRYLSEVSCRGRSPWGPLAPAPEVAGSCRVLLRVSRG